MKMRFTLYKETEIRIDIPRFIEHILNIYHSKRTLTDGKDFDDEVCDVIEKMTLCDPVDYDNGYGIAHTLVKNAVIHAVENNYSQTDIDILNEISALV